MDDLEATFKQITQDFTALTLDPVERVANDSRVILAAEYSLFGVSKYIKSHGEYQGMLAALGSFYELQDGQMEEAVERARLGIMRNSQNG